MVLDDKTIVVYIHCGWVVEFTQGNINLLGITYQRNGGIVRTGSGILYERI